MQKITINSIEITLNNILPDDFSIQFIDPSTGLEKRIECEDMFINPKSKLIRVNWSAFDITPTGLPINRIQLPQVITSKDDYDFFLEMFGSPIKKFAKNGLFRQSLARYGLTSYAVYTEELDLITHQPVPFPEPPPAEPTEPEQLT